MGLFPGDVGDETLVQKALERSEAVHGALH